MRLLAGASGYSYKEWKGNFYPADIKPDAMLAWYAERLPSVEINNTFYRMPKASVLENWAASTPESTLALGIRDRKSTRLNSSHLVISYAVFCLKKKKNVEPHTRR